MSRYHARKGHQIPDDEFTVFIVKDSRNSAPKVHVVCVFELQDGVDPMFMRPTLRDSVRGSSGDGHGKGDGGL